MTEPTYNNGPLSALNKEQAAVVLELVAKAGVTLVFGDDDSYNQWTTAVLEARKQAGVPRRGRPPKPRGET